MHPNVCGLSDYIKENILATWRHAIKCFSHSLCHILVLAMCLLQIYLG